MTLQEYGCKFSREWALPNKWTFSIAPIKKLLNRYVGDGKGWIDPFAGMNSPAEFTNDLNPETKAQYHIEAVDFVKLIPGPFNGVIIDPPYSGQQVVATYKGIGRGFDLIEILLICHGGHHNDTIVTVERKVQTSL